MSSYRQILYHIVFRTKSGKKTLAQDSNKELYAYILGIIKNKNCFLYRINGMEEHIHILSDLHPNISLADYMSDISHREFNPCGAGLESPIDNSVGYTHGY